MKKNKIIKIILIVIFIILLIIGGIIFALLHKVDQKIDKIEYIPMNTTDLGISETQKKSKFRNIAILGTDSRYNDYDDFARTDCIMILSINTEINRMNLFSIYRDTFTKMTLNGEEKYDKINHAYYGGVENTLKTINRNFDLNVSEYIMVDFEAVASMVDQVGGIELNITPEELKIINKYIVNNNQSIGSHSGKLVNSGNQKVDGVQALAYGRIRYTAGGDYKRTERMRTVLEKVFSKIKTRNLKEIDDITNYIMPKIKTNISKEDIKSVIPKISELKFNKTFGFPYHATSKGLDLRDYYKGTKGGLDYYVIPLQLVDDVEKLHKEVFEETDYQAPESVKEIYNEIKTKVK